MSEIFKFGETVEGYSIPVLNEREIRAAAGLLFLMLFISVMTVILKEDFTMLKFSVTIFLVDICIRVFINPKYSPTLILGRLIVHNQTPEYVGAQQKKFAWKIGVFLASIFFIFMVIMNSYSPVTGLVCFACLFFLFFEAAFGICLGCKFYPVFHREKPQLCPGEVCQPQDKQEIQKTSKAQLAIVLAFIGFIVVLVNSVGEIYSERPYDLFGLEEQLNVSQTK